MHLFFLPFFPYLSSLQLQTFSISISTVHYCMIITFLILILLKLQGTAFLMVFYLLYTSNIYIHIVSVLIAPKCYFLTLPHSLFYIIYILFFIVPTCPRCSSRQIPTLIFLFQTINTFYSYTPKTFSQFSFFS